MAVSILKISWDDSVTPYVEEYYVFVNDVYIASVQPGTFQYLYATETASTPAKYEVQAKDANGVTILEKINVNVVEYPLASDVYLGDLLDVNIVGPDIDDVLTFDVDTSTWVNKNAAESIGQYIVDIKEGTNIVVDNTDPNHPIISSTASTSAGSTNRRYLTGDEVVLAAGTFFLSGQEDKGTVVSANSQSLLADAAPRAYFDENFIGSPAASDYDIQAGTYAGSISVGILGQGVPIAIRAELHVCDNDGNQINPGTPLVVLTSGLVTFGFNEIKEVPFSGAFTATQTVLAGQRIEWVFEAEKYASNGDVTVSVLVGTGHSSYIDIPAILDTDSLINKSNRVGASATDALNSLDAQANSNTDEVNIRQVSKLDGEPAGTYLADNTVLISREDYQAAEIAGELVSGTVYLTTITE